MEEWIQEFLRDLRANKAYADNTIAAYQVDIVQFYNYVLLVRPHMPGWSRVDRPLLLDYVVHLRNKDYTASSIARKVAALKTFFFFLIKRGVISTNPSEKLDSPRLKRAEPRALQPAEIDRLLQAPPDDGSAKALRDQALLELLAATGMRVSELVGLDEGDLDWQACAIRCAGQGVQARTLPLRPRAWQALVQYLENGRTNIRPKEQETALFLNMQGDRLTRQGLWLILKTYVRSAGIDATVTPYTLRHSFAMQLLQEGQAIEHVQKWLGHSHKTTTQKYTLKSPEAEPITAGQVAAPGGDTDAQNLR